MMSMNPKFKAISQPMNCHRLVRHFELTTPQKHAEWHRIFGLFFKNGRPNLDLKTTQK